MTAALLLALFAPSAEARPAFLDSPTEIRVWLESPLPASRFAGKFKVSLDGKTVQVKSVEPGGEQTRPRTLPQTPGRVILAGTLQAALGGREWDPDGEVTQMEPAAPGVYRLVTMLPKGRFEFKVTRNGSWAENYGQNFVSGGQNIPLNVPIDRTIVAFVVDFNRKVILNSLDHPTEVQAPPVLPKKPTPAPPTSFPVAVLKLVKPVTAAQITGSMVVTDDRGVKRPVYARSILDTADYVYTGNDLGSRWSKSKTTFKVWSPVSKSAKLVLFRSGMAKPSAILDMQRAKGGIWAASVSGDLHGVYYQYEFESYGKRRRTQDINCYAASPDSSKSMVVDLSRTHPTGWPTSPRLKHRSQTDAVLYEISVRDFTVHSLSVNPKKRGKYAGLAEVQPMKYLADLGITDVHLLPTQNFLTNSKDEYTWGYATNLFNVPEETYSATPNSPTGVIREFKSMVQSVHKAGMRVVMDVVYNHTWPPEGDGSAFWQTVPYYYFRTNDRGDVLNESGVGNALHDERPMARKFVRDSLLYWLKDYKVDGFRFDLLGMHHPDSVRDWATAVRRVRPDATLYGEPWTGGGPTRFGKGDQRGTTVAVFNDNFRNLFRGDTDGDAVGFAAGGPVDREQFERAIRGSIGKGGFTDSPEETINYVSAHDNMTFLDRIAKSLPNDEEAQLSAAKLSFAGTLLSQGVPFLEGGVEIGRTKGGNHNSYDAGDKVNGYDWTRAKEYLHLRSYLRGLISLRRSTKAFRLSSAEAVEKNVKFLPTKGNLFAYTVQGQPGDKHKRYLVVLNGSRAEASFDMPTGLWDQIVYDSGSEQVHMRGLFGGRQTIPPLSAAVFVQ